MPPVLVREFEHWKVLKASEAETKCYYYNTKTKEVTWSAPPGLLEVPDVRPSYSESSNTSNIFGTTLPIDKLMSDHKSDDEQDYEVSCSESDRPRIYSVHGPNTINSPLLPQPPLPESGDVVIPQRIQPSKEVPPAAKPDWVPVVGQPCGALWTDGHYWKATVVAQENNRYRVMYDVDSSEAWVAREALRPPKAEPKAAPVPEPKPTTPVLAPIEPSSRTSPVTPSWSNKDANAIRAETIARQNMLFQLFTTEFPNLRPPSLEDFYRPQYAVALQRFGPQDFELLCDAPKGKGTIGRIKMKMKHVGI